MAFSFGWREIKMEGMVTICLFTTVQETQRSSYNRRRRGLDTT